MITQVVKLDGKRVLNKGARLTDADLPVLAQLDAPIHAVRLDPDDVHEDEAAIRIASAISGNGLRTSTPVQSRVNIRAASKRTFCGSTPNASGQ
ncbi:MAG: hypothetical protein R2845_12555 [Thermomicrobiales bacterium]